MPIPDVDPRAPDLQQDPNDVIVPDNLPNRRSARILATKAAKATGAPSWLERTLKEVGESRVRVEEARAGRRRKWLEDIREQETRNEPVHLDEAAKEGLKKDGEVSKMIGGVTDISEAQVVDDNTEDL